MTIKIIMICGPLRSGKDTAGNLIKELSGNHAKILRMIDPVKEAIHVLFDVPRDHNFFELKKDFKVYELFDRTPRSTYIDLTENWLKKTYGSDILGKLLYRKIARQGTNGTGLFVIPGVGQGPEVEYIAKQLPADQLCLIQLERPLTSFKGDTRGYITLDGVATYRVSNGTSIKDLRNKLADILTKFTCVE